MPEKQVIIQNALEAIITVNQAGVITSWNTAAENIFGWTEKEALDRKFSEVITNGSGPILPGITDNVGSLQVEKKINHKDGRKVAVELLVTDVSTEKSPLLAVFARDISKRWEREKRLNRSLNDQQIVNALLNVSLMAGSMEDQLELILELILSIKTIKLLPSGAILLVEDNPETLVLKVQRGFSAQQIATCSQVPFGTCHCGRAARSGEIQFVECIDSSHDFTFDKMKPHGHYCVPIRYEGRVLGVIALYIEEGHRQDGQELETLSAIANVLAGILARKKMDTQLVELVDSLKLTIRDLDNQKKFNESVIGSLDRGLMILDKEGRIEKTNPAGELLIRSFYNDDPLGRTLAEVIGKTAAEQIRKGEGQNRFERAEISLKTRTSGSGKKIFEYTTVPREDASGQEQGTIITLKDVTDLKKIQAEMEKMNRFSTIAEIASAVAHEVRNPLAGIRTMSQAIDEQLPAGDDKKEYIQRVIKQVDRLNILLTDFFTYARPPEPKQVKISLKKIMDDIKPLVSSRISKCRIALQESYQPKLPDIMVDPNQIQQVFLNLMLNAIDAIKQGGTISVKAESYNGGKHPFDTDLFPWLLEHKNFVSVHFSDDGCGIPDEISDKVFEPFFTNKHDGSGLGLSIVYRILKENNAGIYIDRNRKKGATFILFFSV
ncbi:MAG: PAS domain S-box protein [Proteobacteria bacterium]|nr:PAS domain S-box protein [Pseudomonadota bacterium]MBU1737120.1 PAS domain S-box protein [Pseudomonadota bacterium]